MADQEKERRRHASTDYDRVQATIGDRHDVRNFLEAECGKEFLDSQAERKLGLLLATKFNEGWDAALEKLRSENGYVEGYKNAVTNVIDAVNKIAEPDRAQQEGRLPRVRRW